MIELSEFVSKIINETGKTELYIFLIVITLLLTSLVYLVTVIESYSRGTSYLEVLKYSLFEVTTTSPEGETELVILRAWGRIHAIEKAAKKMDRKNGFTFKVEKSTRKDRND